MIDIDFEVTGRTLTQIEGAVAAELVRFVDDGRAVDYDMSVSSRAGTYEEHPNVVLWTARVHARIKEPHDQLRKR